LIFARCGRARESAGQSLKSNLTGYKNKQFGVIPDVELIIYGCVLTIATSRRSPKGALAVGMTKRPVNFACGDRVKLGELFALRTCWKFSLTEE
jgi:hypothetical protein